MVLILATSILLALFYQVVSVVLLPLFLAAVTVLLLRPLHLHVVRWCNDRRYVAALLMTVAVLMAILVPVLTVVVIAGSEAIELINKLDTVTMQGQLDRARYSLGLDYQLRIPVRWPSGVFAMVIRTLIPDARARRHQSVRNFLAMAFVDCCQI